MLLGLDGLSYKERLGLVSLQCRRLRGDLIEAYKITRGTDKAVEVSGWMKEWKGGLASLRKIRRWVVLWTVQRAVLGYKGTL
eukprot:g26410.t1